MTGSLRLADCTGRFCPARPVDLFLTLAPLRHGGRRDPSVCLDSDGVWRATRTPAGPATILYAAEGAMIAVEAWGPGAQWAVAHAPVLLGALDNDSGFQPRHPLVAELHRSHRGLRIARTEAVFEALLPAVLEQKVPSIQAGAAHRGLVAAQGEPAPGPAGLRLPPAPRILAGLPYWWFHRLGVERRRADTIRRVAACAASLERAVAMPPARAFQQLTAVAGVGAWTAAKVAAVAFGDADAVPLGDYHLPHLVSWALEGRARGSDERMLELLEPYRGHRGRVVRLLLVAGIEAPRFGPRAPLYRIAAL